MPLSLNLLHQIYLNIKRHRPRIALYLTTVLLILSNFLHANLANSTRVQASLLQVEPDSLPGKKSKLAVGGANDSLTVNDSSSTIIADTIQRIDSISGADQGEIQDVITYKAADSIVYDMNTKKMYLYNGADVHYQKIQLNANLVDFDWNTFTLTSQGTLDSSGQLTGNPVFTDDGKEYKAKKMKYNFKTKKGIVFEVLTK